MYAFTHKENGLPYPANRFFFEKEMTHEKVLVRLWDGDCRRPHRHKRRRYRTLMFQPMSIAYAINVSFLCRICCESVYSL